MSAYRYHNGGQNNWAPQTRSGLSREFVHGKRLLPMAQPKGEISLLRGWALLCALLAVGVLAAALLP